MVESKLRRLKPTVYCGGDAMTLRVQGSTMPNFMIDGGGYTGLDIKHSDNHIVSTS